MDFVRQAINNIAQTAKKKFNDNEGFFQQGKFTTQPIKQAVSSPANISYTAQKLGLTPNFTQGMNRQQFTNTYNQSGLANTAGEFVQNRFINTWKQLPQNTIDFGNSVRDTLYKPSTSSAINMAKKAGTLGINAISSIPDPTDLAFGAYDALKGYSQSARKGGTLQQNLENARQGFTYAKPVGLGDALSDNPVQQMVGNLAELPLTFMVAGRVNKAGTKSVKELPDILHNLAKQSGNEEVFAQTLINIIKDPRNKALTDRIVGMGMTGAQIYQRALKTVKMPLKAQLPTSSTSTYENVINTDIPLIQELAQSLRKGDSVGDMNKLKTLDKTYKIFEPGEIKQLDKIQIARKLDTFVQDRVANKNIIPEGASNTLDPKNFKSAEEYVKAQGYESIPISKIKPEYYLPTNTPKAPGAFKVMTNKKVLDEYQLVVDGYKKKIQTGQEFEPIIINKNNVIVDGQHRFDAYKQLGIKEIPIIRGSNADVFNQNIKTKSQLTDIWNKANNVTSSTDGKLKLRNLSGGIAGVEMYQDENGKWQTRYNPVKGIAGVVGMTATSKMGGKDIQEKLNMARQNLQEGVPKFMSNLPIEEDGSTKARLTDVKKAYEEWVNTRRATKLEGVLKQKELSELDAKGVEGIMDYQVGKTNTKVREYFDAKYKQLKDAGIEFGYQKDYLPQLWDNTAEEISTAMGRSLGIRPTFSMEKVIKDYKTGIALGLKPRFQTVGELAGWYERTANKALADNKFFKHLYDDGQILLGDSAPKGWQTISPDRFPKIRVSGELGDYKGTFKAEPETAKLINNYLNDASDETLQKVADYVSKVKNITLNFGIPGTAINSHGVNILARHTLFGTGGNPITRFLTGAKYMINPKSADKYLDTSMQRAPQAIKNGLTLSAEGYEGVGTEALGFKGRFGKKWEQAFGDPLFHKMIPSLKLSSYEELVKNNMDPKDASKLVNTVYGGINWEAMGRDRNVQNWARAIVLAPDWAETTLRIGGNIAKSLNPLNKGMVMNRYRTMGATALGSIVALNVANKISSGHYAYENEPGHTFELESGYTNDGQKRYIRPFGTALDMVRLPFDIVIGLSKGDPSVAVRAFTNRLSIPLSSVAHLAFNIDYKGQKIYGQDKYGNPIEPLQAVGGITSEVAGLTGFPSFAKNLVDSATGKQGIEQGITQALELPFRYTNTGKSALSKQVAPLANLKGKELYDLNASLKGESKLSDNQMEDAMMGAKPIEVVKSIIGDRQANRADKLLDTTQGADTDPTRMEYGEGGHKNIKALDREIKKIETRVKKGYMSPEAGEIMKQNRMDSYGGSQSDLDNYKKEMQAVAPYKTQTENVKQLQAKVPTTQYAMVKKQQEQIALASTIYNNDKLTEEMKTSLLNKLSVSKSDMEYYQIAKDTVDMKQIYVNEQVQSLRNNGAGDQEVYKWLKENQKEVNGKSIVTATILKQLAGEGQISYAMSGALKKVTTGKAKLRAGRKVKKPKKLGKIKVSYKAPKLTKLKVKIPKLAKIKMLKPKKVKTA